MRKQFATALRADARNLLKRRGSTRFSASGTVAGNGETVRLVAHLLDQVQRWRVCGKRELVSRIVEVKSLQSGFAGHTLGYPEQDQFRYGQLFEYLASHVELPLAAIDQQNVRQLALTLRGLAETPGQRLVHRRIVIARGNTLDVVASIVRLQRPLRPEDHAGRHRRLAAGMADVEAFQAHRRFVEFQRFGQCVEPRGQMLTIG